MGYFWYTNFWVPDRPPLSSNTSLHQPVFHPLQVRMHQLVLEEKADMESGLITAGHSVASAMIGAQFTVTGYVSEQMGGLSYFQSLKELLVRIDDDWDSVLSDLQDMKRFIFSTDGMLINATCDAAALQGMEPAFAAFMDAMPSAAAPPAPWEPVLAKDNQALVVPTQVPDARWVLSSRGCADSLRRGSWDLGLGVFSV